MKRAHLGLIADTVFFSLHRIGDPITLIRSSRLASTQGTEAFAVVQALLTPATPRGDFTEYIPISISSTF